MTYRQRADGILALSFLCFLLVFWWWYTAAESTAVNLVFFVVQSALIGSIADWFAVTALFEKPLGFPWHTELVHRHRNQIIDGMTTIVSEKLLQPQMWQDKLYSISFIDRIIAWLETPSGREKFRALLYEAAQKVYLYAKEDTSKRMMADNIRRYLKRQPLVSLLQDRIIAMLENPESELLGDTIGLLKECVQSKEFENILMQMLNEWIDESKSAPQLLVSLHRFTGMIDTRKMAIDIKKGLVTWLDRWEHAGSKERQWLCRKLEIQMYSMNGQLTYTVEKWQDQFVDSLPIEAWVTATQRLGQAYFTTGVEGKEKLQNVLEAQFKHYLAYCRDYPEIKQWLNEQIRRACEIILAHEHALIGVAVRDVLSGFDKKKFNQFLESKVGEDLAWIRINGALVGATIGLFVFLFFTFMYTPVAVPLLRSLFL